MSITETAQPVAPSEADPYTAPVRYVPPLFIATVALAACATTPAAETGDAAQAETQRSSAVVFVERSVGANADSTVHVGARFVQYTGITADALPDLLGTPRVSALGASGCTERAEATTDSDAHAEARLLDVGGIDVRAGERTLHLEPRRFPDLWNVVSGVIYATDGDLSGESWHFSAPGNPQAHTSGFDVDVRAPDDLASVSIADQPVSPDGTVTLPRRGYSVRWNRGDHDDTVLVSFEPGANAVDARSAVDCTAHDDGEIAIDSSWADRIADLSQSGSVVTVHRLRARPLATGTADVGSVVFDVSLRVNGQ